MLRHWRGLGLAIGGAPLMEQAPDAGSGGGAADPGDGGAGDTPADGGIDPADPSAAADETRSSAEPDDDEDDDDPDLTSTEPITPERFNRVAKKLTKLSKRDRRWTPTRQRLKDLQASGLTLDDLVTAHRNYMALDQSIRSNPKLRALIHGESEPAAAPERTAAPERPAAAAFDESTLPFDANENPTNRYFADMARRNHEQAQRIAQLESGWNTRQQQETAAAETAVKNHWISVIQASAAQIKDEGQRDVFKDAMAAAFHRDGRTGKVKAAEIARHYLAKFGVDPAQAAKANQAAASVPAARAGVQTAATRQRLAEQNKQLPRTVAPAGTPAPARSDKPSLGDIRKRLAAAGR